MKTYRLDDYQSAILGVRAISGGTHLGAMTLYGQGGIFARVVDLPAEDVTAKGITLHGDIDGEIAGELDRLQVMAKLTDALRWSRLTGGAAMVLIARDGRLLREPLNVEALQEVEEIKVFDLTLVTAEPERYSDPRERNFGQPIRYRVNVGGNTAFVVHESRLIEIGGDPLPQQLAMAKGVPWAGRSAVDRSYKSILEYCEAVTLAKNILKRKQQAIYKMQGLADAIENGLESLVQKRIDLVDAVRGVLNTVAVDAEDEYGIQDSALSGISDVLGELKTQVSADTGMPITLLFGEAPGGLNATGKGDRDNYHALVRSIQKYKASPALERLISILFAQSSVTDKPDNWRIEWPAISQPTDKESAEIRKINAEAEVQEMTALEKVQGLGIISEEESYAYLASTGRYGLNDDTDENSAGAAIDYAQTS